MREAQGKRGRTSCINSRFPRISIDFEVTADGLSQASSIS